MSFKIKLQDGKYLRTGIYQQIRHFENYDLAKHYADKHNGKIEVASHK